MKAAAHSTAGAARDALEAWLESQAWSSYDPYDGLTSPLLRPLYHLRPLARAALQVVKRSPVNLRPALGIRPAVYTKSLSDFVSAYTLLYRMHGDERHRRRAREFLALLHARILPGFGGTCWGMDLPYVSRFATATPSMPNLFQTVNAAMAVLDAHAAWGEDPAAALGVVDFLEHGLGRLQDGPRIAWRYYPGQDAVVYNVNALTAALLARLARITGREDLADSARRTFAFVTAAQNDDGSWWYASGPAGRWVDGFHSGYVLEALAIGHELDPDRAVEASLRRGAAYYLDAMFTADCIPRYTDRSTYPIEVQNCAQAIQTLSRLAPFVPAARDLAPRVAARVVEQLFRITRKTPHAAGYFMLSRGRRLTNRLAAIRWGQAPMFLALVHLEDMES